MHLWYRLLDQADRTLNLLQPARINPTLSAYNMIWGKFYFNRTPMGSPGCKIIFHEKPVKCGRWAFHGVPGFYIGPFMNGYRTYKVYIPKTRAERSAGVVDFFPQSTKMPFMSTTDVITKAVADIRKFLKNLHRRRQSNKLVAGNVRPCSSWSIFSLKRRK